MNTTIYTDGHGIKVTTNEFVTGEISYRIDGILNASVRLIKAALAPAILLILLGIATVMTGFMHLYSQVDMAPFYLGNNLITANRIAIITGALLFFGSIMWCIRLRDKYAVHIVTAEGEKDPVISTKRDYVSQIVSALQQALILR